MFRTVGEQTAVRPGRRRLDPADEGLRGGPRSGGGPRGAPRPTRLGVDVPLLLVVITLIIFGLLMLYSASYDYSLSWYGDPYRIFIRQLMWLALGTATAGFLVFMNYRYWNRLAVLAMGVTLLGLVAVFFFGEARNNALRALAGGSIQPSELAKLVTVIYLAVWLYAKREKLGDITFGLIPLAVILGLLGGLIFLQPDVSAVLTLLFLGGVMFFLAGGDLRQILILLVLALFVGLLVVQFSATGQTRVNEYLAGLKDPIQASYHVRRALEAFVKGGWLGAGIGRAETKLTGLPVPPTDSIFAVVGEETGVLGATALVVLYTLLLWRGLTIARRAPDDLGALLAAGLALWIVVEAYINMAVIVNLLPFAGNALPFVSAGGSNLVVSLAAIGIMLNVSRQAIHSDVENGRLFGAVIDLRRWDRRRRVPRPRRPAGPGRE